MHKDLFSHNSLKLGQIHWYLLKANNEMAARCYRKTPIGSSGFSKTEPTDFGKEVSGDEIHWWVFKRERAVDELRSLTEHALESAQRLKASSAKLLDSPPKSYSRLVGLLKNFADTHSIEIAVLHSYVSWLHSKDVLAPSILYAYRVWGTTRLSDRWDKVETDSINTEDPGKVERLTEIVCGLFQGDKYTVDSVRAEVESETYQIYADIQPEELPFLPTIKISQSKILRRTSYETLREFAAYFEFIRNSLRNVISDIDKYVEQRDLMKSDTFWRNFIAKAISSGKVEPKLWDFKKTLNMWHIPTRDGKKDDAELKFAETVASFANTQGGVLIVGVADTPREIIGIGNDTGRLERRLKYANEVLVRYLNYEEGITYFHQVSLKDKDGNEETCLVIAIAQSSTAISVKDKDGRYTYPIRLETGLVRADPMKLGSQKVHVKNTNYDFISVLNTLIYDR